MPLIWNNKEYMLVGDDEEWDKLEYVIARKLHVQYDSSKIITVSFVKKSFEIYGNIEKIEIFRDNYSDTQFAHVTFKENRTAYFALIDSKQNKKHNIVKIAPADAHQQPDNPIDSAKSPLYNLPDKCLLTIFNNCDIHTLACLSVVCKKMSNLLRTRVFANKFSFEANTSNETEVKNALVTANQLLQCIDPVAFELKIYRNIKNSVEWPTISVDFVSTKRNRLSVDMNFLKPTWICNLEPIAKRIHSIRAQCSVYDTYLPLKSTDNILWSNATTLIISGFASNHKAPDYLPLVCCLPKLETILIRCTLFGWNVTGLCSTAKSLQNIYFDNCLFDSDITRQRIIDVARVIKSQPQTFPLCMIFDHIRINKYVSNIYVDVESTYTEIQQALSDEDVKNYVRIEIGGDTYPD